MLPPADDRWLSDLGRGSALVFRERGLLFRGVAAGPYSDGLPAIQTVCAPVANDGLLAGAAPGTAGGIHSDRVDRLRGRVGESTGLVELRGLCVRLGDSGSRGRQ